MRCGPGSIALALAAAACGGSPGAAPDAAVDARHDDPLQLRDGRTGAPADYTCDGAFTLGSANPASPHLFHVASLRTTLVASARLDLVAPATGQPTGTFTTADAAGDATLAVPGNSLIAWKASVPVGCPDTCVDAYGFAVRTLTAADAAAGGVEPVTMLDIDDYVGRRSLVGATAADAGQIVGTVTDCAGAPVQHARVQLALAGGGVAPTCGGSVAPTDQPCVSYFQAQGGFLDVTATGTDVDGRFAVFNPPDGAVTIDVVGIVSGDTPSPIGSATVVAVPGAVSFGAVYPRSP